MALTTRADKNSLVRYLRWSVGAPELAVKILQYRSNGNRLRDSISWSSVLTLARRNTVPRGGDNGNVQESSIARLGLERKGDTPTVRSHSPVPSGFLDITQPSEEDIGEGALEGMAARNLEGH